MGSYAYPRSVQRLSRVDEGERGDTDEVSPIEYHLPHELSVRPQTSSSSVYSTHEPSKRVSYTVREVDTTAQVTPGSQNLPTSDNPAQQPLPRWVEKLGWFSLAVLVIALVVILGSVSFLSFLWFTPTSNPVWLTIMSQGWGNQAVSISALLIRNATDFQIGIAVAMLAALALESYGVRLFDAAGVSMMRAGNSTPWTLIMPMLRGSSLKLESFVYVIPAVILLIVALLLQFTSTVLLSDLQLGTLPAFPHPGVLAFDYSIATEQDYEYFPKTQHISPWMRNPTSFPTYAEYSAPPVGNVDAAIDDTGTLLRVFLPFSDSSTREKLHTYDGNALLLDSRVMCVAPDLDNLSWDFHMTAPSNVTGSARASVNIQTEKFLPGNSSLDFSCPVIPYTSGSDSFSVCQIADPVNGMWDIFGGALLSEFSNATTDVPRTEEWFWELTRQWGRRFLVIHTNNIAPNHGISTDGKPHKGNLATAINGTSAFVQNQQWTEVPSMTLSNWSYSFSLCYSAWNSASLPVWLSGDTNRTEPQLLYHAPPGRNTSACQNNGTCWDFTGPLVQANTNRSANLTTRGVLQLNERSSWVPDYNNRSLFGYSWIRDQAEMGNTPGVANWTTFINWDGYIGFSDYKDLGEQGQFADPIMSMFFLRTVETSGSIAYGLSTLLTVLSNMVYYEQLPQFTASGEVNQAYFTTVQYPQGHRGFLGVVIVLAVHVVTISVITVLFLARTRFTLLDNSWVCVAQLMRPEVEEMLDGRSVVKDEVVEKELEKHGATGKRVGLGRGTDGVRVRFSSERANTW